VLTLPQQLRAALESPEAKTLKELSAELSASERDIGVALEKLERSLQRGEWRFEVEAARCIACEFVFQDRARLSKPSRCPECRSERIAPPRFRVVAR
jgi:transcriptional regulator